MNRDQLEKELLLQQSGELSPSRRKRLEQHLESSAEARQLRDEILSLTASVRNEVPEAEAGEVLLARIMEEGRAAVKPADSKLVWLTTLPRFVGAAAGLAVLFLSGWLLMQAPIQQGAHVASTTTEDPLAWEDNFDERMAEIESLFVMNNTDQEDSLDSFDIDSIARELLILEGESI